jgi:hypothetical protein
MDHIEMATAIILWVERPLDDERPYMAATDQARTVIPAGQPKS